MKTEFERKRKRQGIRKWRIKRVKRKRKEKEEEEKVEWNF